MFLNYIFQNNIPAIESNKCQFTMRKVYEDKIRATKYNAVYLYFDKLENLVYNADLTWTVSDKCLLKETDFNILMTNVDKYYGFDTTYLSFINYGDNYFVDNRHVLYTYKEVYSALYNLMLFESVKIKDRQLNMNYFIESTENFMTLIAMKKKKFNRFDINIDDFYPLFKLISLYSNLDYFKNHDNMFLRFESPDSVVIQDFVFTLGNLRAYLDVWKVSKDYRNTSSLFRLDILSDVTITKEFTQQYHDSLKRVINSDM